MTTTRGRWFKTHHTAGAAPAPEPAAGPGQEPARPPGRERGPGPGPGQHAPEQGQEPGQAPGKGLDRAPARDREPAAVGATTPITPVTPITPITPVGLPEALEACARACGRLTAVRGSHPALAERLILLPAPEEPDPPEQAEVLDALLAAGKEAVATDPDGHRLALMITNTVLPLRKDSRPAWDLRARALEALGDLPGALDAYERYLRPARSDAHARSRVAALRAAVPEQRELAAALGLAAGAPAAQGGSPVRALEAAALERIEAGLARYSGRSPQPVEPVERGAGGAGAGAAGEARPGPGAGTGSAGELSRVIALYADQRRHLRRSPVADPTYGGVGWLGLGEFRNLVTGRSICLVANSATVRDGSLGATIDGYDLVVRFTSYVIEPAATGSRTDVHVSGHRRIFNWERPAGTRLILGDRPAPWRSAIRSRLVPGAQTHVGDESLRAPVRGIGGLGTDAWPEQPTCAFEAMWLLDFLDVSPRLDLIGFDFHRTGPYRLPNALPIPVGTAAANSRQKAWVMERAQHVAGPVISLR